MSLVRKMDAEIINTLVWDKGNCSAGDLPATYGKQWEAILFARKKRIPLLGSRDRDILRFSRGNSSKYYHPTQKPVELIKFLMSKHSPEGLILDPFSGGGTTAIAALELERPCIVIELEEKYCEITANRLERI